MSKGTDRKQNEENVKSDVINLLKSHEPLTKSSIQHRLGIDKNLLVRILLELVNGEKIAYSEVLHLSNKRLKNEFYFIFPLSVKIKMLLWYEKYWKKFDENYYFGIKQDIPIPVQWYHKTSLLGEKFRELQKLMVRRDKAQPSKNLQKLHNSIDSFIGTSLFQSSLIRSYLSNYDSLSEIEQAARLCSLIEFIDEKYSKVDKIVKFSFRDNSGLTDHQRYMIIHSLIESTIGKTAKDFDVSTKTISKINQEFSNEDGSLKVEKINHLVKKNFGVADARIGEELEKKRKRLNKN